MKIIDFGLSCYEDILVKQEQLFKELIEAKTEGKEKKEYIMIGEHYPVITIGRKGNSKNILISQEMLNSQGIRIFDTKRGGDVTYHCEGQMIAYPILDLDAHKIGVKDYVDVLEECVIRLLKEYGIKGERIEGATGVWLGKDTEKERKICAIGIKCSRFCTMHGLALNVKSDLRGFEFINPCGFVNKGVTSIFNETNCDVPMTEVKSKFINIFENLI